MDNAVKNFSDANLKIKRYFKCKEDCFVKVMDDYNWSIKEGEGISFFMYWKDGQPLKECVISKKNDKPLIFKTNKYTMVIAIECVKVALVVKNENNS